LTDSKQTGQHRENAYNQLVSYHENMKKNQPIKKSLFFLRSPLLRPYGYFSRDLFRILPSGLHLSSWANSSRRMQIKIPFCRNRQTKPISFPNNIPCPHVVLANHQGRSITNTLLPPEFPTAFCRRSGAIAAISGTQTNVENIVGIDRPVARRRHPFRSWPHRRGRQFRREA